MRPMSMSLPLRPWEQDSAHLEGGPAPGAVAALKTLEELRVVGFM